jgi:hypothetical protein
MSSDNRLVLFGGCDSSVDYSDLFTLDVSPLMDTSTSRNKNNPILTTGSSGSRRESTESVLVPVVVGDMRKRGDSKARRTTEEELSDFVHVADLALSKSETEWVELVRLIQEADLKRREDNEIMLHQLRQLKALVGEDV